MLTPQEFVQLKLSIKSMSPTGLSSHSINGDAVIELLETYVDKPKTIIRSANGSSIELTDEYTLLLEKDRKK